jgi:hypothetical protein
MGTNKLEWDEGGEDCDKEKGHEDHNKVQGLAAS